MSRRRLARNQFRQLLGSGGGEASRTAGDPVLARRFLYHLAEGVPDHELAAIADLALDWGEANTALTIAKLAASRGIILPRAYFR
jgi:soluble lytic murein transglycosylase